ncbi:diguanylate cyclase (GGDEF)-like protein [Deinococcus metalli]|uniref:Diguanylate cyclase (GGDEF)-like protein n=1 Tax=Deinococcus metalli TaxID=1141878 RepID=A0A7W8NQ38_9DEIO|nr:GGDEF domain-containing protein [Deinococcus metalli]MBB5375438.1 diguanylate cyclase (GGDEF)-like protein [Deinococcus metalli]GHF29282.1 hypothetical protein GCM10017781_01570 [Deinococcus metalli]
MTEHARRRAYTVVAAVASVIQFVIALVDVLQASGHVPVEALAGSMICGVTAALLALTRVHWQMIDYGVLIAATLCVGDQLLDALNTPTPPPARLLFTGVFLFVAAFSILRAGWAVVYVVVAFTGYAGVVLLRGGDVTLLGELGLCGVLIAHLSTYGRQLSVERAEREIAQRLALTDPLTGLENRRAALARLNSAFDAGSPLSAVLVDVDHFKTVNDTLGHDVGDDVLRGVARTLQAAAGPHAHVARWGGEEFLVTLAADHALDSAERMRVGVERGPGVNGPSVTVSVGVARPPEVDTVRDLLRLADARLYEAKVKGRNRVESGRAVVPCALPISPPEPETLTHAATG